MIEEHQFPLTPTMYDQKSVCEQNHQAFISKVDFAVQPVEGFESLPNPHPLVVSWYLNKRLWKAG